MKKNLLFLVSMILLISTSKLVAQNVELVNYGKLPEATIKKLDGTDFKTSDIKNGDKPFIVIFWATWCYPCLRPLDAIHAVYDDWIKETGVKIYIISVSISQNLEKESQMVSEKQWKYETLADVDNSLMKYYKNQPTIWVFDKKQDIRWGRQGYVPHSGEESLYLDAVKLILKEEN